MWLAFSARPLKLAELAEAVIVEPGISVIDPEARWNPIDLLSVIGSLIIYSKEDGITLAHHSIKDYLLSTSFPMKSSAFSLNGITSNIQIAETCLTYLLVEDFSSGACFQEHSSMEATYKIMDNFRQRCKDYPLLRYASSYWPFHAREYLESTSTLQDLAYTLMNPARTGNFWAWLECFVSQGYFGPRKLPPTLTPLYFAASLGLATIVSQLVESGVDINAPGGMYGGTPLHAAVFREHPDVARILLQAGASVEIKDHNGHTPLYFALHFSKDIELVDLLSTFYVKQTSVDALEKQLLEFRTSEGYYITHSESHGQTRLKDTIGWTCCVCGGTSNTRIAPSHCILCDHVKCLACKPYRKVFARR